MPHDGPSLRAAARRVAAGGGVGWFMVVGVAGT
jgi:hypothetical protein